MTDFRMPSALYSVPTITTNYTTPVELLDRMVDAARNRQMTPAEVRAQRISFVYGQMNGAVSKEWISQRLTEMGQ